MGCTQEEWDKLKSHEQYGMYVALDKRLSAIESILNGPVIERLQRLESDVSEISLRFGPIRRIK